MKNKFTSRLILIVLFCSYNLFSQTLKWEDRMNGDNSVTGLQSRGWVILNEDGGGVTPPWFQGGSLFLAFEGPDTGYVAANYNGANTNGVIDQWLISPAITVAPGDTLNFWARSPNSSAFDDSINIMYSSTAGITPAAFVSLGRFLVDTTNWQQFFIFFNSSATMRFAIRYYLFDGGPSGARSNYIGLDMFQLITHTSSYPSAISISKSFGFSNITSASSYRMIGMPGDINLPVSVTGTRKTDWNAYYDNGAASNYLVEYDGSANFNFKPGNGFWILSKNNININVQVNSVALAGDNTYSIPLHSGWNIISNPFERSTNWAAVQTKNGLAGNSVIYDWGGTWTNPTSFIPYKAYYFNNTGALTSLKVTYDPAGTLGKTSGENMFQVSGENDIKLSLLLNGEERSKAMLGFNSLSTNDFDNADYFAPPGDFEESRIVIRNSDLSTNYKFLMKESRKEIGDGQTYNLEVKNLTGKELNLSFEGLANYQDYQIFLVDERLNNATKLLEDLEIKIPANVKNNNYRLLIGTQQFIDANIGNLTPSEFALYQNYPNPFNPTTKIRYAIPLLREDERKMFVTLKLYDLLGNEVMTLLNEEKSPGNYEIEFDASGLASGVYMYKMQGGSFTESRKMVLLH